MDRIFLMMFSRTIGWRLLVGPGDFFGLGRVISVPSPSISMGTWCSNDELMILASGWETMLTVDVIWTCGTAILGCGDGGLNFLLRYRGVERQLGTLGKKAT